LGLRPKNSHLAGSFGPAKDLKWPKAAQEHGLALWASQRSLAPGGCSLFGCDQRSQQKEKYQRPDKRLRILALLALNSYIGGPLGTGKELLQPKGAQDYEHGLNKDL